MKKQYRILAALTLIFVLLAGCSKTGTADTNSSASWDLSEAEPIYVTEWPENKYTAQIFEPENGEIDFIYDFSDAGRYCVWMKDMTAEESEDYVEKLRELGFSEVQSEGNEVSAGVLLQRAGVSLSVSYSGQASAC